MVRLLLASIVFLGLHTGLSAPTVRPRLVAALGENRFRALYALGAAVALAAMVWGLLHAPAVAMWEPVAGMRWIPILLMPLACVLLVAGVSQPNPTAVNGRFADPGADPAPGALKITRHPVMWAIGLWALGHFAANGTTRALVFFGGLGSLALFGTLRIDAKRAARDPAGFARLAAATSNAPFAAILAGRQSIGAALAGIGAARLAGAALLYAAFWFVHVAVFGRAI
jgi:uncharacterized membrane protein